MSDPIIELGKAQEAEATPTAIAEAIQESRAVAETGPLAGFLDVGTPDKAERDKLDYIRQSLGKEGVDLLMEVRGLEQRLAPPRLGESRLGLLYNYVRSLEAVKRAESERDRYVR